MTEFSRTEGLANTEPELTRRQLLVAAGKFSLLIGVVIAATHARKIVNSGEDFFDYVAQDDGDSGDNDPSGPADSESP